MVLIDCPWCDEESPVDPESFGSEFTCAGCGTSALLDDASEPLELAPAA